MKRTAAILISILALLVAVQPVVALHFCGNKLVEYSLVSGVENACCDTRDRVQCENEESVRKDDCCSTVSVVMHTDDYTVDNAIYFNDNPNLLSPEIVKSIFEILYHFKTEEKNHCYNPPPDDTLKSGRDILVSKCVLII